ncbi:DivIVA domain-containing protein [Bacilli bacterium PM5-3]|nr:DivIVA domain-containing protein [Bacilli bacterium PM5-3]MDH6603808.1 DivIVA domain-containing protein [Bacilli bacterium PM5-9]
MEQLKLNSEVILDKEFDVDIKGYSAKQVDMFLDIVYEDYLLFEKIVNEHLEHIKSLQERNENLVKELEATLKNQVVSNEMVQTEQINTIDILKRLSKLEQEVYNQK